MTRIELKSKVGPDGVLTLCVPIGMSEANRANRIGRDSLVFGGQG